jgi:hypothetical protein
VNMLGDHGRFTGNADINRDVRAEGHHQNGADRCVQTRLTMAHRFWAETVHVQ